MTGKISAVTARTQFDQVLDRVVEYNDRFLVELQRRTRILIIGVVDFVKTAAPTPD